MKHIIQNIIKTNQLSIEEIFIKGNGCYTFINPVSYLDARKNIEVFYNFNGIFADGSILTLFIRLLYGKSVKRYSFDMTSIAPLLFKYISENGKTIYFIGSKENEISQAILNLNSKYKNIKIVGYRNGYFGSGIEEFDEVNRIVRLQPDFLVIGMGVIKQEEFLLKVSKSGYKGLGFTCGGFIHQTSIDMIDYYPDWIDRYNIRFLYRFIKEKHTRIRYLRAALIFPLMFIYDRFKY